MSPLNPASVDAVRPREHCWLRRHHSTACDADPPKPPGLGYGTTVQRLPLRGSGPQEEEVASAPRAGP